MFDIIVRSEKGMIEWNYEALKTELTQRLQRYQGLVFSESEIKEAKDTRALLNKVSKAIDDERKKNKKIYMEPFEVFETQAKELTGLVANVAGEIDAQVKSFEQQAKETKRAAIEEFFKELRFHLVPLDMLFDDKWLNASVSDKQWKEQLSGKIETIKAELAVIDNYPEEDRAPVKTFYLDCLNLTLATNHHNKNKEQAKALQAYENERKQAQVQTPTIDPEVAQTPQIEPATVEEERLRRKLWCEGTREDIIAVGEFMKSRGMRFGKLED